MRFSWIQKTLRILQANQRALAIFTTVIVAASAGLSRSAVGQGAPAAKPAAKPVATPAPAAKGAVVAPAPVSKAPAAPLIATPLAAPGAPPVAVLAPSMAVAPSTPTEKAPPVPEAKLTRNEQVRELLQNTGFRAQLEDVQEVLAVTIQHFLDRNQDLMAPKAFEELAGAVQKGFVGRSMYESVEAAMVKDLDDATVSTLLDWYRTPPGSHLHSVEVLSGRRQGIRDITSFLNLARELQDEERIAIAHQIDRLTFLSDDQLNLVMTAYRATAQGANHSVSRDKRKTPEALEVEIRKVRLTMRDTIVRAVLAGIVSTFQPIKVEEFQKYIDFVKSPAYRLFNRRVARAVGRELEHALAESGRQVAALSGPAAPGTTPSVANPAVLPPMPPTAVTPAIIAGAPPQGAPARAPANNETPPNP